MLSASLICAAHSIAGQVASSLANSILKFHHQQRRTDIAKAGQLQIYRTIYPLKDAALEASHDDLRIFAVRSARLARLRDDGPVGQIFWSRRGQARATLLADGGARARLRADEAARGALWRGLPRQCGHRVPDAAAARGRR